MKTRAPQTHPPGPRLTALLATALVSAAVALGPASAVAQPAAEAAPASPPEAHWHPTLDGALAAAAGERYILVDLYAEWCGWCKKMDAEVFSTASFAGFATDYVLLRVDVEDGGEGAWLQERLGVRGLPTLAILGPDLAQVGQVRGFKQEQLLTLNVLRHVAAYEAQRAKLDAMVAGDDRQQQLAAADELRRLKAGRPAAEAYRKAAQAEGWSAEQRLEIAFATAESLRLARDHAGAQAELAHARGLLDASRLDDDARSRTAERLDLAALRLADELGDCQQLEALESFVHERQASTLIGAAKSRLDDLKAEAFGCS